LRNLIGHGLIDEVPREAAALLIYAAIAMARIHAMTTEASTDREPEPAGA